MARIVIRNLPHLTDENELRSWLAGCGVAVQDVHVMVDLQTGGWGRGTNPAYGFDRGLQDWAVYNGTKAFIDSFSFALRAELKIPASP